MFVKAGKRSVNFCSFGPLFCRHSSKLLLLGASGWLFCVSSFCLLCVDSARKSQTATLALHHAPQFASSVMPHFGPRSRGEEDKPYGWGEQVLHNFRFSLATPSSSLFIFKIKVIVSQRQCTGGSELSRSLVLLYRCNMHLQCN